MMLDLVDNAGRPYQLGAQLGKGGEGGVYELVNDPTSVVKLYHQNPLPDDQRTKLEALVSLQSDNLQVVSAWPSGLVYEQHTSRPRGIVMPRVNGARHLHELYGTLNRRKHFPGVDWRHMVLAARNTAAAFHTVQETGVVIGDVNQGNLMVDPDMCVRLIDCDSFQVHVNGQRFACPVGTPHFTPPELQSLQLREVDRTVNHDNFGMAVLIFHLLFMGRHPFAGRYLGPGEMPIEKAIAERRFAFSTHKSQTLVEPPPASLLVEDLPPSTGELFERAFRSDPTRGETRPTALEWAEDLERLLKQIKGCKYDSMHYYYAGLKECPWCRVEDTGGPAFFVPAGDTSMISMDRLTDLNNRVKELQLADFPDLTPAQLKPPKLPVLENRTERKRTNRKADKKNDRKKKASKEKSNDKQADKHSEPKASKRPTITIPDVYCGVIVLAGVTMVFSVLSPYAAIASAVLSLAGGAALLFDKEARHRRKTVRDYEQWLASGAQQIEKTARNLVAQHAKDAETFNKSRDEIHQQTQDYRAQGKALVRVLAQHMDIKRDELLRNQLVRDNFRTIGGLKPSMVSMLESYGVESAYDIEQINLYNIPNITPAITMSLLDWRKEVERRLVLKPDHGVTPEEMQIATEAATRRYKVAQARRVLTSASRLASVAASAQRDLNRELKSYRELGARWRNVGSEMVDFQANRRRLERKINHSPATILTITLLIPTLGAIAWSLLG